MFATAKRARLDDDELPLDFTFKTLSTLTEQVITSPPSIFVKSNNINQSANNSTDTDSDNCIITVLPAVTLSDIPNKLLTIEYHLSKQIEHMTFGSTVKYIYNPMEYALSVHSNFLQKYCVTTKKVLLLGMNPGPWGMSQTGIPFGEIRAVVDWLEITGFIGKPTCEHSARKVTGFACKRSEISGRRFWNFFKTLCNTPEIFFQYSFLRNHCPVALMDSNGRNITPAELKGPVQKELRDVCDRALLAVIDLLKIENIIGIGRFAEQRAKNVVKDADLTINIAWMPHPSPRSTGNENWNERALRSLRESNLLEFFQNSSNPSTLTS